MTRLAVYPVVEGHGEVESVGILLRRVWTELLHQEYVEVLHPHRVPRSKIVKADEIRRAIELGRRKLEVARNVERRMVLVLLDADDDVPCVLAPQIQGSIGSPGIDVSIVIANAEYETWFVGAAESLEDLLLLPDPPPTAPEVDRCRKRWIEVRMRSRQYSETVDQPRLTARMDPALCRDRCPSFDKLCRELQARI
jgi:hypothetical protein